MGALIKKLKEALVSVLPVTLIVCLLNLTPLIDFTNTEITIFMVSSLILILGIGLFNMGADLAMTPMGEHIGAGLTKSRSLLLLLSVCFGMGLLITVAEPDLSVLAEQVAEGKPEELEIACRFCGTNYRYTPTDIAALSDRMAK